MVALLTMMALAGRNASACRRKGTTTLGWMPESGIAPRLTSERAICPEAEASKGVTAGGQSISKAKGQEARTAIGLKGRRPQKSEDPKGQKALKGRRP